MDDPRLSQLTEQLIGASFRVHNELGSGFLEKVYENALAYELRCSGLAVEQQARLAVQYRDQIVGEYFADLLVENRVICELKAVESLTKLHEVQLVNYLSATGIDIGLLINFGRSVTVKKKFRTPRHSRRMD